MPGLSVRVSVRASRTAGTARRRCGATMSSALGDAARKSSGECAAATSAPLAATAASASSAAHLSSSSLAMGLNKSRFYTFIQKMYITNV